MDKKKHQTNEDEHYKQRGGGRHVVSLGFVLMRSLGLPSARRSASSRTYATLDAMGVLFFIQDTLGKSRHV